MSLANMLVSQAPQHSLLRALQQMNPKTWGALQVYRPPYTRKYVNGRSTDVVDTAAIAASVEKAMTPPVPVIAASVEKPTDLTVSAEAATPVPESVDVLIALERFVRRMPRTFVETDVPADLRGELPTMVKLGILACVSRKRADIKQYLRAGV